MATACALGQPAKAFTRLSLSACSRSGKACVQFWATGIATSLSRTISISPIIFKGQLIMVTTDQFGMLGLLGFLKAAETDPSLASVTFGTDLTALGLDLAAADKLYPLFAGPWSDQPLKVYEVDYPVPAEYLVNSSIREKLTQITLKRYHEDTIFFLFYMFPNDVLQIAAAIELYSREWRYHKEEKVWITRAPGITPSEKTNSYERGTYYIFDATLWRRVPKEFVIQYDLLESKPTISSSYK